MKGRAFVAVGSCLLLSLAATQSQESGRQQSAVVPGEILVMFQPATSRAERAGILAGRGAQLIRRFETLGVDQIQVPPTANLEAVLAGLRSSPAILLAQPNYTRQIARAASTDDPYLSYLWGIRKIRADAVWADLSVGDPSVVVADIDTGVNYNHPDLAANMWRNPGEIPNNGIDDDANGYVDDIFGIDPANGDSDPMDDHGHGTLTSGIVAAVGNNGVGVVGVTWRTAIVACKFLNSAGSGTDAGAAACFDYLIGLKQRGVNIRVSNNSWGGPRDGTSAVVLQEAIDRAGAAGILNVFAAGNSGTNNDTKPYDPASFPSSSIVAVAASTESDGRASFSNYGRTSVDIAAPGVSILSTMGDGYSFSNGTSMAAPYVAGAAALVLSMDPALSVDAIKALLMNNVDVVSAWNSRVASGGRLNVFSTATAPGVNVPPTVSLITPVDGSAFPVGGVVSLQASAADSDGAVTGVEFYANGALVGAASASPYAVNWAAVQAGQYRLTAVARDDRGATRTSTAISITVGRMNVALAANGGQAVASSTYSAGYPAAAANNGDRLGLQWGSGGGWADGTYESWPDWLEIQFSGLKTIDEIDVFTVQDNYSAPVDPTPAMTFGSYGLTDFEVQFWTGSAWQTVPGGAVFDNAVVWRQFRFAPVTTSRIRVLATAALNAYTRLTEVEAYSVGAGSAAAPTVSVTSPVDGADLPASQDVVVTATASADQGSVVGVDFYVNGLLIGSDTTSPYSTTWTGVAAGSHVLAAVVTDSHGATTMSAPVSVTATAPAVRMNVALAANGGQAVASSTYSAGYPAAATNNGDRLGLQWGSGGGWADGTYESWPDWLEIRFSGLKTIDEIDVFTVQDNYSAPVDPTPTMTFSRYGLTDFEVQFWTGSAWQTVPGGAVAGNTLVWRRFQFQAISTSRVRVLIIRGLSAYGRLTEVEAYTVGSSTPEPSLEALLSPLPDAGPRSIDRSILDDSNVRSSDRRWPRSLVATASRNLRRPLDVLVQYRRGPLG